MRFCLLKASGRVRARTRVDGEQVLQKDVWTEGRMEGGKGEYYKTALNFK